MKINVIYKEDETRIEVFSDKWFKELAKVVPSLGEPDEDSPDWNDTGEYLETI